MLTSAMRLILRLEGLCLLIITVYFYSILHLNWWLFVTLFLVPDLALLAYLHNHYSGAIVYNCTHSTLSATLCLILSFILNSPLLLTFALIWGAHIGFDRTLGYGLKYTKGFHFTHLGIIGNSKSHHKTS